MSVIISDCYKISNSPINTSKTKQLYSFSKDQRFKNNIKAQYYNQRCDKFYELPSTKTKIFTTFGYGHRDIFKNKSLIIREYSCSFIISYSPF